MEGESSLIRPFISVLIASAIAIRALMRKSLDLSGAFLGFLVMFIHFYVGYRSLPHLSFVSISCLDSVNGVSDWAVIWGDFDCFGVDVWRFGALLLVFFFTSSKLTKLGEEKKRIVDADFKEGGQRNWYSWWFSVFSVFLFFALWLFWILWELGDLGMDSVWMISRVLCCH